uniref:Cytochrome b n=2 Tax=Kudoa septempunctata TaxID=751907 RepID=A0A0H5B3E6_9CNID|nr:cytochrome b [Kudoa septempunctata]
MFSCGSSSWWTWNLGFMSGLALSIQVVSGVGLALGYEDVSANVRIEYAERHGDYWSWRRAHSVGATIYFIAMYSHMARSILSSSLASSSSWSGCVLYFLSLTVALLGYSLTEGNMARWALTVVSSVVLSLPAGESVYPVLVGNYGISSAILPRIYAVHFLLGLLSPVVVVWHALEVHHNESSTDLSTRCGPSGKDFISGGGVKDSLVTVFTAFLMLEGFDETSWIWSIIEDINANDWPQENKTPEPIGPEWYVLTLFAGLKLASVASILATVAITTWAYIRPREGSPWRMLALWITISCFLLGKIALKAHESLEEASLTAFLLILASWSILAELRES